MTDDTDHPLDSELGGDNLVHLPVVKVERGRRKRAARAKASSSVVAAPVGRPTDYRPEFAEEAAKACEAGATDADLAEYFEVDKLTIFRWKLRHAEFCSAIKDSKGVADDRVEHSLYQRALGYTVKVEKVFANGYSRFVTEHVPADTTAMIFWLKNRRPAQWRDVHKVDHTVRLRSPQEILEDLRQDVIAMGLLPAPLIEAGAVDEK